MAGTSFTTQQHHSPEYTMAQSLPVRDTNVPAMLGSEVASSPEERKKSGLSLRLSASVNANGCFEHDRVLKLGNVHKRTRKTKSWKSAHLVLRPHTLSMYADSEGTKLRHQIKLADVTAVARQRDPKKKERHVFALFSPERNFHIEAPTESEAQSWVELIRSQARIEKHDEDEIIALMSPTLERQPGQDSGFFGGRPRTNNGPTTGGETSASEVEQSAPIPIRKARSNRNIATSPENMHSAQSQRKSSVGLNYFSGTEQASYSDFSDAGPGASSLSLSLPQAEREERARKVNEIYRPSSARPSMGNRSASGVSLRTPAPNTTSPDRIAYNGHLYLLRSKGGMRQWKSVWAVLRSTSLALYKNEQEYEPLHIYPFSSILEVVDIDDLSRGKRHCFQVIMEERRVKFCARSEREVAEWVGGFQALLVRRREGELGQAVGKENVAVQRAA